MRSSWPADRLVGWILPILAILAEGAWLTVVYVAVETTIDGRPPILGTLELAAAAGLAAVAVRRGWLRPDDHPLTFFAAVVAFGAAGWLWDDRVRSLVAAGDVAGAIGLHPGGWLLLVAAMRGVGRGVEIDDRALTRLVLVGVPLLAVPWVLGQVGAGDLRPVFVEHAFVASLTFISAGFMAAGLARLQEIGRETGVDWRTNRSWLGTVLGVLAIVLALGVPAASLLGLPVGTVTRGLIGPFISLLGYLLLAVAIVAAILSAALYEALSRIGIVLPGPLSPRELARLPEIREYTIDQLQGPITTVAILWIAVILLALIVIRTWVRRRARGRSRGGTEERTFSIPQGSFRLELPRIGGFARRGRRGAPTDAVGAYLATLDDLSAHDPPRARREAESPHAHAARVALPGLGALQADYALARYGDRHLTSAENRRALSRWRRIRLRLRSRP
ncbi:MAG: hypothetical protein QOI85_2063 [Chloroflexota bacterium]|jgi:hypothetical protein|nr:hypothetical protein [Chloroflexota bacterium]